MNDRVKKEGPVWPWIILAAVIASALSMGTYYFFQWTSKPAQKAVPAAPAFKEVTGAQGAKVTMKIYFPTNDDKGLLSEQRQIVQTTDESQEVKELVTELIRGPLSPGLSPALPQETQVKSVFIDPATGTAYIDFSREVQTQFPGGAWTETLAIYSVVNSLTEDFPDIRQVQFLVEGIVTESLAGHIDTTRPFAPRTALNEN